MDDNESPPPLPPERSSSEFPGGFGFDDSDDEDSLDPQRCMSMPAKFQDFEEEPAIRNMSLPFHSAEDLLRLFPEEEPSRTASLREQRGLGRPYRRVHAGLLSDTSSSAKDARLRELAQRLRENRFDFGVEDAGQAFKSDETAIIFDWDDTLFPTSHLEEVVEPCLAGVDDGEAPLSEESPFAGQLMEHAEIVRDLLRTARASGRVGIVTLSTRPWVLNSARKYIPWLDIEHLLDELEIPIVYARECLKRHMFMETDSGTCAWTHAKQLGMRKIVKKLCGLDSCANMLSVGDSIIEQDAAIDFLWGHSGAASTICCKTIKLVEKPTLDNLQVELRSLKESLPGLVQMQEDFDYSLV
eukprot:TRINITY_DN26224_c0_g1_i1.p1 TRINITY_DN26224_c0_g1~~TRINITY_DN26224_c0_g1_i1.p1  ORF type:complete len:356 (-),score=73.26 TRINITY_DN26224_c0_g1_i1:29-1096(-)